MQEPENISVIVAVVLLPNMSSIQKIEPRISFVHIGIIAMISYKKGTLPILCPYP